LSSRGALAEVTGSARPLVEGRAGIVAQCIHPCIFAFGEQLEGRRELVMGEQVEIVAFQGRQDRDSLTFAPGLPFELAMLPMMPEP